MVSLELHHLVLSLEEVPHQLGVLQVLGAVTQSSSLPLQLLYGSGSTTPPEGPHTSPRLPHPGFESTCPRELPIAPPPIDGESPLILHWPLPEEHVTALQWVHHISVSSYISQQELASQQPHPSDVSLLPEALPCSSLSGP
jgi:hypothetical protein